MTRKLYCYVDESGQDTQGDLFIVAVVIAVEDRDELLQTLEAIERATGKNRVKWNKTLRARKWAYIERVLTLPALQGRLHYALYRGTKDYLRLTAQTIGSALTAFGATSRKITVLIDALPPTQERVVNNWLRRAGLKIKNVRGVRRDENDTLIKVSRCDLWFCARRA